MKIRSIIFLLIFCVPLLTAAVPDIVEKQSGNIPAAVEKLPMAPELMSAWPMLHQGNTGKTAAVSIRC